MKYLSIGVTFLFFLTSCTAVKSYQKDERSQMEVSFQRLRSDVEELKHDLSTQQMQMNIFEGKITNLNDMPNVSSFDTKSLGDISQKIAFLEKKVSDLASQNSLMKKDIIALSERANETVQALSHYKRILMEFETALKAQRDIVLDDMSSLKKRIGHTNHSLYIVKSGDSLDKIAKNHGTSTEEIKRINNLKSDLIKVGDTIKLPR